METIRLKEPVGEIPILTNASANERYIVLLAHGAGAGMNHPFLAGLAQEISSLDGTVIRFNFPYLQQGKKFPSSPRPNIATIGALIEYTSHLFPDKPLFLSGKSYGGRMSSHWVAEHPESPVRGLIYFGFPLHTAGKDSSERANHLYEISTPQLFIQGTHDKLANFSLISQVVDKCRHALLLPINSADHSFKVPGSKSQSELLKKIAGEMNKWATDQLLE